MFGVTEGTRFYFRKTEGETWYKYMSQRYTENEKGKEQKVCRHREQRAWLPRVRPSGAVHWWCFEMEVKSLPCKIKDIGMRRCFLILNFPDFETLISVALIFFSFLVDPRVVFVLNKEEGKLHFAPIHGSN